MELLYNPVLAKVAKDIESWAANCLHHHSRCSWNTNSPTLPTRVIDVVEKRLVVTNGLKGEYITLSHCWGPPDKNRPILTKGNLSSFQEGIHESVLRHLPRSFLDAACLTAKLGIRYLWIDSLCILQDDQEDWARESARMVGFYNNAYCTFAASIGAPRSLFPNHHPSGRTRPLISEPYPKKHENSYAELTLIEIKQVNLATRGWTFQEYLLSRRLVHFTRFTVAWECLDSFETIYHYQYIRENGFISYNWSVGHQEWHACVESGVALKQALMAST
jgi:hypothetical protein